ncbi:ArsR family transcriptional regulator [Halarchaeum rubridurum]|uniref:ArsR family transcriptional regulator n=1 Tax=Halarchaeum rubridurum TaxID=489911 RepID=A0A830FJC6_9EURY|nr:ArsR family transcriptional regulator [Halarchaeum rubridurum]MBP1953975.1 ArsR family transcriptional regulator [Halarchaeum rubridurum]GGM56340.1 MarR family transcriptional regulator [Halarchaeum rubridurum]
MDSGALLDLLGNENRRRILRLLARKPCYVTEISEYLGVSPKAVIDHLRRLEEAGLVESRTDEKRRKYFHIARNLRLEVTVSRHGFGAKSAYPASRDLDLTRCHHLTIDGVADATGGADGDDAESGDATDPGDGDASETSDDPGDIASLADELAELEDLERELSLAQRWVQGRLADVRDDLAETLEADGHEGLYAEVVAAVADGEGSIEALTRRVDAPAEVVEHAVGDLLERDVLEPDGDDGWRVTDSA